MALQLKSRVKNVNIANGNFEVSRITLNIMVSTLAGLAFLYVLILGNMVFDIVERKALEKELLALTNEVSELELTYLNIAGSIDLNLSASMGFKETKANFATRKSLGRIKIINNEI